MRVLHVANGKVWSAKKIKETFPLSVYNRLKAMVIFLDIAANFRAVWARLDGGVGALVEIDFSAGARTNTQKKRMQYEYCILCTQST